MKNARNDNYRNSKMEIAMKMRNSIICFLLCCVFMMPEAKAQIKNEQKLNSTQKTKYLEQILADGKSLSAVSYAQNFVSDCQSIITLDLYITTEDNKNNLKLYYVCTDDPSHDSTVTIFLNKNGNINGKGVGITTNVEFGIE